MNQTTEQAAIPTHLVSDPEGVRYEPFSVATTSPTIAPSLAPRTGRVVVGLDGSDSSIAALHRGIRIASALNTTLETVTSWRYPSGYADGGMEYSPYNDAESIRSDAISTVFTDGVPDWFTSVSREGNAAQVLVDESRGAEMLIVGSRGHGGVAGLLLGSVSAVCAEHATCPVLIIH
ncbi:universal stress protein [Glaciihabitans sp. UYNi722]|uniref:universal stress protein n=1 Tax=Glaciihabitans sp. UYNi722 TaxID=3156344 RepID=UPI0033959631